MAYTVAVVGWLTVLAWPDSYEASARVYVATSTPLRPLLQGIAVDQDIDAQLNLVRESLLGRSELEAVARTADLDVKVKTPTERETLITDLRKAIHIEAQSPEGSRADRRSIDSVYEIKYENHSRDKALSVVKSLLSYLVDETLGGKRSGSDEALKFLREQIADYEKRLQVAENALAGFKKRNVGLVPGAQGDYFTRLQTESIASQKALSALEVALRRREELGRQMRGEKPLVPTSAAAKASAALTASPLGVTVRGGDTATRIAETQARLDDLLLRFTERHPDVIAARETLAELKRRQVAETLAAQRGDPNAIANSGLAANPVFQALQVQLSQVEVDIAALRADLADHQRAEANLRKMLNTAPEVEAQYAQLNRDYDVTKAQYNSLLDRLDKAKLAGDAQQTGIVRFEIIDPPAVGTQAVKPKRPILVALVLLAALVCGVVAAWALAEIRPVFSSTRALTEKTGLPVLGAVSLTWVERAAAETQRGLYRAGAAAAGLVVICLIVLMLHESGSRLLHSVLSFT